MYDGKMRTARSIAYVMSFALVAVVLSIDAWYVSYYFDEDIIGPRNIAELCVAVERNPKVDPLCRRGGAIRVIRETFPEGITNRVDVQRTLGKYYRFSGVSNPGVGEYDVYAIVRGDIIFKWGTDAIFSFDENNTLESIGISD